MSPLLLLISPLLCLSHLTTAVLSSPLPRVPNQHSIPLSDTEPALPKCTYYTVTQPLNHFGPSPGDFEQRLCIVDEYFDASSSIPPTVFFYVGNESPVEEYVNNTGLMYTLAPDFNALLVFAEHRYMGESTPMTEGVQNCMGYDSMSLAMADYAAILGFIKSGGSNTIPVSFPYDVTPFKNAPVITFGGSYGGMLSAYIRRQYPSLVTGAIAASAPVWGLPLTNPPIDAGASFVGHGMTDQCAANFKSALVLINEIAKLNNGLEYLSQQLNMCDTATSTAEILDWLQVPWFDLAEGNFPFPSTYITFAVGPGSFPLPAWPIKVACEALGEDFAVKVEGDVGAVNFEVTIDAVAVAVDWDSTSNANAFALEQVTGSKIGELLGAVTAGVDVWCNVTGELTCNDPHACTGGRRRASASSPVSSPPSSSSSDSVCTVDISVDKSFNCWEPMNCNDDLNLPNTLAQGLGNDIYWPPTAPKGTTLESFLGERGVPGEGCEMQEGLYGFPKTSDPWSTRLDNELGGLNMDGYSNVVFSNGYLDPWASGGVRSAGWKKGDDSVIKLNEEGNSIALIIEDGAHHLDLFFPNEADPDSVLAAREVEKDMIKMWIEGEREKEGGRNGAVEL